MKVLDMGAGAGYSTELVARYWSDWHGLWSESSRQF